MLRPGSSQRRTLGASYWGTARSTQPPPFQPGCHILSQPCTPPKKSSPGTSWLLPALLIPLGLQSLCKLPRPVKPHPARQTPGWAPAAALGALPAGAALLGKRYQASAAELMAGEECGQCWAKLVQSLHSWHRQTPNRSRVPHRAREPCTAPQAGRAWYTSAPAATPGTWHHSTIANTAGSSLMAAQPHPCSQGSQQRLGPAGHHLCHCLGPLCMAAVLSWHILCPEISSKTAAYRQHLHKTTLSITPEVQTPSVGSSPSPHRAPTSS